MTEKPRILLVDDDPNLRKTLADILRVKGYETVLAETGAEALIVAGHTPVSVALIDLRLPDMSGIEVMERLKAISPLVEAIVLTGHASMDTAIQATKKGAFSYLLKPYQMDDLLLDIRHAAERWQAQGEILRLASHPRLNPNPIVEIDRDCVITYVNPAAQKWFPELAGGSLDHPLLAAVLPMFADLRQRDSQDVVREVAVGASTYEAHLSFVPEAGVFRIHVLDITQRQRAEASLAAREREQAAVAELGTLALAGLDLLSVFARAATLLADNLKVEFCAVLELLRGGETLLLRAGAGWDKSAYGRESFLVGPGTLAGHILASNDPIRLPCSDPALAMPAQLERRGIVGGLALGMGPRGSRVGLVGVFERTDRAFSVDDTHFVQAIANVLAAAVQRRRADEAIHVLATTDRLTGATNRGEFTRILEREIERSARYGTPLSLVMFDIDHFKRVNDSLGHDAGDLVLLGVTAAARENIRSVDTLARWGGEEFMVVLPGSDLQGALALAGKLRSAIASRQFDRVDQITVSLGAATFRSGDDVNTLSKRVDAALYKAKQNGRNRVETLES